MKIFIKTMKESLRGVIIVGLHERREGILACMRENLERERERTLEVDRLMFRYIALYVIRARVSIMCTWIYLSPNFIPISIKKSN